MKKTQRGFSLIELLIVVAIILIIAAIAIPDFLHSRMAANQASAVESLRVINSAEVMYYSNYNQGYSSSLADLKAPTGGSIPTPSAAGLIDNVLASGAKSGYTFIYVPNTPDPNGHFLGYTLNANPTRPGNTGSVYYYTDQSYVIRFHNSRAATSTDTALSK